MSTSGPNQSNENVDWRTAVSSFLTSFQEQLAPIVQFLEDHRTEIAAGYLALVPSIEELRDTNLKDHISIDKATLATLMKHGWYLNPQLSLALVDFLVDAFDEDPAEASQATAALIDSRITEIQMSLENSFPKRRDILHDAFYAHRTGLYNLSVPVFLSQADGMWRDRLGRHLFDQGGPSAAADIYKNQVSDKLSRSILASIDSHIPLWIPEGNRDANFNALNRHQVLHGESVDYGTKEYSLKAISFLHFIAFVLENGNAGASVSS